MKTEFRKGIKASLLTALLLIMSLALAACAGGERPEAGQGAPVNDDSTPRNGAAVGEPRYDTADHEAPIGEYPAPGKVITPGEPRYEFVDYKLFINENAFPLYGNPALPFSITVTVRNVGGDRVGERLRIRDLFTRDVTLVTNRGSSFPNWHPEWYVVDASLHSETFYSGDTATETFQFERIPLDGRYVLNFSFDRTQFSIPIEVNRGAGSK